MPGRGKAFDRRSSKHESRYGDQAVGDELMTGATPIHPSIRVGVEGPAHMDDRS